MSAAMAAPWPRVGQPIIPTFGEVGNAKGDATTAVEAGNSRAERILWMRLLLQFVNIRETLLGTHNQSRWCYDYGSKNWIYNRAAKPRGDEQCVAILGALLEARTPPSKQRKAWRAPREGQREAINRMTVNNT